jgi:hypothetical protein
MIPVAAAAYKAVQCFGGMAPGIPRLVDDDILAGGLDILSEILSRGESRPFDTCILGSAAYGAHRLSVDSTADILAALW